MFELMFILFRLKNEQKLLQVTRTSAVGHAVLSKSQSESMDGLKIESEYSL